MATYATENPARSVLLEKEKEVSKLREAELHRLEAEVGRNPSPGALVKQSHTSVTTPHH